jgi:hypothetical protein
MGRRKSDRKALALQHLKLDTGEGVCVVPSCRQIVMGITPSSREWASWWNLASPSRLPR